MSCEPNENLKMWEIIRPDDLMVFKPMTMTANEAMTEVMEEYLIEKS